LLDLSDNEVGRNEATRLWELRLNAEERRFDALLACGHHRRLVADLMASVDAEPLREERWALLMLALYRCGRQAEALRTYHRLRDYLGEELGIEPSPALSALEVSILNNQPELDWTPLAGTVEPETVSAVIGSSSDGSNLITTAPVPLQGRLGVRPAVGLVGRTTELDTLKRAVKQAASGQGTGLVFICGEAGSGKTALLAEAARAAVDSGACVLFGHCEENLGAPYQLFVEALGHFFAHAPEDQFLTYVADHGSGLSRLAPVLEKRVTGLSQSKAANSDAERGLLFSEVVGVIREISKHQPVVFEFDDLQWADPDSLHLLRHLITTGDSIPVLVVGAYRDTDVPQSGPLLETLGMLRRDAEATRIELTGLDSDNVVSYMEAVAGHSLDEILLRLAEVIHLETDGNPFFVGELLRHLFEVGAIHRDETGRWTATDVPHAAPLPNSVSEVIGARVVRIGHGAKAIFSIAATIGRDFDFDTLRRAASISEDELLNALDAGIAAALVREDTTSAGRYSFVHALIQRSLYEGLGPTRRARAHRKIAESLEELFGENPGGARAGELARHWLDTGLRSALPKALAYSRQAADAALAALAPADALRYYSQAQDICADLSDLDPGVALDLSIGLGIAQRQTGNPEYPEYRETLFRAADRAIELGDTDRFVTATLAHERQWASAGVIDSKKIELLERALGLLDRNDPRRALVLGVLCQELTFWSPLERRLELAEEALLIAESSGDDETIVRVLILVSIPLLSPHTLADLRKRSIDLLIRAERVGDADLMFWATNQQFTIATCSADADGMDRTFKLLERQAAQLNLSNTSWAFAWTSATRSIIKGDFEPAERLSAIALQLGTEIREPDAPSNYGAQIMMVNWQRGTLRDIIPLIEQFAASARHMPVFVAALALAHAEVDQTEPAMKLLGDFANQGYQLPVDSLWLTGMTCYAEAAAECRDLGTAEALYAELIPWRDQFGYTGPTASGPVSHVLGGLAAALGRYDEAYELFAQSEALCKRLDAEFFAARTDLAWGKMLVARNRPEDLKQARDLLTKALNAGKARGYATVERRATSALARLR
jgi:tetratricopeptide (TPR) repeat protein